MANWIGVITNGGNDLLNEWVSQRELRFDSAAAGTGTVAVASMMAQTQLVSRKQEASILGADRVDGGVRLKLRVTAHETGYTLNQYGVWASLTGGDSILIALFQHEQGIQVPSKSESQDFVYTFYALIGCSNTGTWTVNVDTGAAVSGEEMERAIAAATAGMQEKITAAGLLKGDGNGAVTKAEGGTDYAWPALTGSGAPTEATKGETMQRYYDASAEKEYVCTGKDGDGKYVWKLAGTGNEVSAHAANHASGGSDPITPESIGAAPDGYGLGGGGVKITDFNAAVNNGWYFTAGTVSNGPKESIYGWMLVSSRSGPDGMIRQDFWEAVTDPVHYARYAVNGSFTEWEYVNPPFAVNTVYRTAERHLGNPVYRKMDADGVIWWSTDQSTWKREAVRAGAALEELVEAVLQVPADTSDPEEYLDNLLTEYIAGKPDQSVGYVIIQLSTLHPVLGGGQYTAKVNISSQKYVGIEIISYASGTANNRVRVFTRSLYDGVWGEWVKAGAVGPMLRTITLSASGWDASAKTQTVTVSGVLADETKQLITPAPALASQTAYYEAVILCTGQAADQLTFTAKKIPTDDLTVYVTIQEVGA